jgi:hypothetical protein
MFILIVITIFATIFNLRFSNFISKFRFSHFSFFFPLLIFIFLFSGEKLNSFMANKLMTAALRLELPDLALDVFEDSFGFYVDADPARGRGGFQIFLSSFFSFFCVVYFFVFVVFGVFSSSFIFDLLHCE